MDKQVSFKNKYTLQERLEKSKRQMEANPNKIVVIVEKHPTSSIPNLPNPRYSSSHLGSCAKKHTSSAW